MDFVVFAKLAFGIIVGLGIIFILLFLKMRREAASFTVTEEEVILDSLPQTFDGTRLFFISDLHCRSLTEEHIRDISSHQPAQLYLIGGDVTEKHGDMQQALNNIQSIRKLGPTYMVHGNHDHRADVRRLDIAVSDLGVKILDNEAVRLEQGGQSIWLVGIDDITSKRANLNMAMEEPELNPACCILLSHDPGVVKRALHPLIELIISGHTHGGQINIPGYGPLRTSAFYRRYLAGWYRISRHADLNDHTDRGLNDVQMFISKGFGTTHYALRMGARPEAHYITLRSRKSVS